MLFTDYSIHVNKKADIEDVGAEICFLSKLHSVSQHWVSKRDWSHVFFSKHQTLSPACTDTAKLKPMTDDVNNMMDGLCQLASAWMSGSKVSQQDTELSHLIVSDINFNCLVLILWLILITQWCQFVLGVTKVLPSYAVCQLCLIQDLQSDGRMNWYHNSFTHSAFA